MFLGVDGGGTKTAFCLVDSTGTVRAEALGDGAYYFAENGTGGVDHVVRVLEKGIAAVCDKAGITTDGIAYAFLGLPGYGEAPRDLPALDAAPGKVLGNDRYACDNDMICGWAGSLGAVDGINVISGTGSMVYGERNGSGVRVGGWSEMFSDEGSAYWIAVQGLNAFTRMSDGRLPEGPLADALRHHLELVDDLEIIDVVLNRWHGRRSDIAGLSRSVSRAAELGDEAAAGILTEAGRELATLVDTARRRLGFTADETVPVSYSGGVFGSAAVRDAFTARLRDGDGTYDLRTPLFPPAIGAALYAAKRAGTPLDAAALTALRDGADPHPLEDRNDVF
ncbi:N-acetylglucosamine kinase-like BadF-type ATPase [Streptomyces sp. B3I7]|uniref:N-acetylglucosamine kinase n=1 Tax=Streptomyces sp. B3I7 TaxID=3042269 RepID=UPI00278B9AD9|nr:BadF/BadG/BcrA/BcrD ATPase family protein [Streptomyces sp. B3I7]MDQ0808994.1 N-acetylglucosamine kinase-like BadF-type ATPase [Streptomyces sp. B3I7]